MSTLTDLIAAEIPKHHGLTFTDDGDWICLCGWGAGEPMGDLPGNHYRHRAETAAAVVADWLESDAARAAWWSGVVGNASLNDRTRAALAAEARKGADQ